MISVLIGILLICFICYLIYSQVKEHYMQDDPMLQSLNTKFRKFFREGKQWEYPLESLNNRDVMDEIDLYRGNKSYTINKRKVYLCLKDENRNYYNENLLVYVFAHELAHVINNKDVGHTENFNIVFTELLKNMTAEGLYDPSQKIDPEYCAMGDKEVS